MKNIFYPVVFFLLSACATLDQPAPEQVNKTQDSIATAAMADAAYLRSDWEASERLYIKLIEAAPDNAMFWYRLGNIYSSTNRNNAAVIAYNESLKFNPADPDVWFNLGIVQLKQSAYTFNS
ncbi:MAG: tetratricopeptide repeat protein, partial [Gammaproteobacteria bacterium]|nr:tetratricopeptide repeat protein [Gammaproteobacteria bacterium]